MEHSLDQDLIGSSVVFKGCLVRIWLAGCVQPAPRRDTFVLRRSVAAAQRGERITASVLSLAGVLERGRRAIYRVIFETSHFSKGTFS
jgi:hypothetical protein